MLHIEDRRLRVAVSAEFDRDIGVGEASRDDIVRRNRRSLRTPRPALRNLKLAVDVFGDVRVRLELVHKGADRCRGREPRRILGLGGRFGNRFGRYLAFQRRIEILLSVLDKFQIPVAHVELSLIVRAGLLELVQPHAKVAVAEVVPKS